MVDRRANFTRKIISLVEDTYGDRIRIFNECIPVSVRAAESAAQGVSIYTHDPRGKVAAAYGIPWILILSCDGFVDRIISLKFFKDCQSP